MDDVAKLLSFSATVRATFASRTSTGRGRCLVEPLRQARATVVLATAHHKVGVPIRLSAYLTV